MTKADRLFIGGVLGIPLAGAMWVSPGVTLMALAAFGAGFVLARWLYTP